MIRTVPDAGNDDRLKGNDSRLIGLMVGGVHDHDEGGLHVFRSVRNPDVKIAVGLIAAMMMLERWESWMSEQPQTD